MSELNLDIHPNIGTYLAELLQAIRLEHYFTVPGDYNLVLFDQMLKNPNLQMINCCNELNAGYAADGYARARGMSAVVITFTVGGLSLVNAVAGAYAEDLPIIFLINNRGYTIEVEIHDGPYNNIKNWGYAGLVQVFNAGEGKGWSCRVQTEGELATAIRQAQAHEGLVLIECVIDRDDCTKELLEWGSRVAAANSCPHQN
jgi:TPP-dependent 2-oxoacid decarboxylase